MARPQKDGLDYFPFDVGLLTDKKLRRVKLKYGHTAVMIYISLLTHLYRDKGYYIDYGSPQAREDLVWEILEDMQGKYQPTQETVKAVIEDLVACELFSGDQFKSGIITSIRSQKTYYSATVERKTVDINESIWLLSMEEMEMLSAKHCYYLFCLSHPINGVNRPINGVNRPINPQSKEKESKEKKSIYGEFKNVLLSEDEYGKLRDNYSDYSDRIEKLSAYIASTGKAYKSHYATILNWARKEPQQKQDGGKKYLD